MTGSAPPTPALSRERTVLALLLVFAGVLRLVGIDDRCPLTFSPTLSGVLEIDRFLKQGVFWREWSASLASLQGLSLVERSAVMLPVAGLFQAVLGPSFELIAIVGCFCGVASVLLAWLVGRRCSDRATALYFAAFVATSPLQIAWSRVGGLHIPAVPHLLLGMWVSYVAGSTARSWCAVLAGVVAWSSLYNNYEARILLVLVPLIVAWAARREGHGWRRTIGLLLAVALPQVVALLLLSGGGLLDALWPKYGAYGTNPDTVHDLASLADQCLQAIQVQAPRVLRSIFYAGRVDPWSSEYGWGLQYGGLYPLAVVLLGLIGLGTMLRDYRGQLVWLALLGIGFLVPALSGAEPRRLLMFDVGWSFAAARGLTAILEITGVGSAGGKVVSVSVASFVGVLGLWSMLAVCRLSAFTSEEFRAIPFGSGTNGDGMFCPPCYRMARAWGGYVARNDTVVLVNGTLALDGALHPGSLYNFARLAALSAGRPGAIVDFYAALESAGDGGPANPLAALRSAIRDTRPDAVVWYFKNPTAWEEELASALVRLGGTAEDVEYPFASTNVVGALYAPHVKSINRIVRTDLAASDALLSTMERQLLGDEQADGRVRLAMVEEHAIPSLVLGLTAASPRADKTAGADVPRWTALLQNAYAGYESYASGDVAKELGGIRAVARVTTDRDGESTPTFVALTELGEAIELGPNGDLERRDVFPGLVPVGRGCSVYLDGNWWVVNPLSGAVRSSAATQRIPDRRWVGIAISRSGELLLASAGGELDVLNLRQQAVTRALRFPVWPSRRSDIGDCAVVGAGDGWYFSYDVNTSHLTVLSGGRRVGEIALASVLGGVHPRHISAVAADGPFLGVAVQRPDGFHIVTLRLSIEAPPSARPRRAGPGESRRGAALRREGWPWAADQPCCASSQRSASIAAMQPEPAAVTACR